MKIDFSFISSPVVSEDRATITGKIGEQDVTVFRHSSNWSAQLGIKIDGVLLHLSHPNEAEKDAFNALLERAMIARSVAHDAAKDAAVKSNAFKKVFRSAK